MSRFWIVGCLATLLVASCMGAQNLVHINGKSGDVILQQKTAAEKPSSLYLYYSQGSKADKEHQLKESEIADFISFLVGGPNVDPKASRKQFPSLTAFNKAKANLMFVIPGFADEQLTYPMMKFLEQKNFHSKYTVESEFYPEDLVARFTTMNTGKSPAEHEIIARTWNTAYFGKTNAFKANAVPKVQSVAASLAAAYEGKPIVVSASADFAYASAFGVYPLDHHSASHFTYYYNAERAQIENVVDGTVLFSRDDLIERVGSRVWKSKEGDQNRYLPSRKELIVYLSKTRTVFNEPINSDDIKSIFNLNDKIDLQMFGEFEVAFTMIEKLKSESELKALSQDHIQDLFSFVFTGVKAVCDKYGPQSSHRLAASYLVDAVMTQIQDELSALYGNQLTTELLLAQQPAASQLNGDVVLKGQVYTAVKSLVGSQENFNEYFPMIYAKDSASADKLCSSLASFKSSVNVNCFPREHSAFTKLAADYQRALALTSDEVSTFQIVLWFSIILVIAIFVVVYSICFMDAQLEFTLNKGPSGGLKAHNQ